MLDQAKRVMILCTLLAMGCPSPPPPPAVPPPQSPAPVPSRDLELEAEARAVEELLGQLHSADFAVRRDATAKLLTRDPASYRYLVIPHLALASVMTPLEVDTRDGHLVRGRLVGGGQEALNMQVTKTVARAAVLSVARADILLIRLFP